MARNLIREWLEKLNIKDASKELSAEEQVTLNNWRRILSAEGDITVDKIKEFCEIQLVTIETQFRDPGKSDREKANLTLVHSVYSTMKALIVSPRAEREALEKYLSTLVQGGGQPS